MQRHISDLNCQLNSFHVWSLKALRTNNFSLSLNFSLLLIITNWIRVWHTRVGCFQNDHIKYQIFFRDSQINSKWLIFHYFNLFIVVLTRFWNKLFVKFSIFKLFSCLRSWHDLHLSALGIIKVCMKVISRVSLKDSMVDSNFIQMISLYISIVPFKVQIIHFYETLICW